MANFQRAPLTLLRDPTHLPAFFSQEMKDRMVERGIYDIFKVSDWVLKVPFGNTTWKQPQWRLIAVWGGDDQGNRLIVTARDPIVEVIPVSERPIVPHTWVYVVRALTVDLPTFCTDRTVLEARTAADMPGKPRGTLHASPLNVQLLPESAVGGQIGNFQGGNQQATVDAIIAECQRQNVTMLEQRAYILATVQHETGGLFAPVRERFENHEPRNEIERRSLRYNLRERPKDYIYYGRGYVQLTHVEHYQTYGTLLNINLEVDPDLALQPSVALFVLVHGMMNGTFGQRLDRHINARHVDFRGARLSVNGTDQAGPIAALAQTWLARLQGRRNAALHPVPHHPHVHTRHH
ncbi:MAG: hypothetical protein WBX00_00445 [Isosphaeraceae bacterium]